MLVNGGAYVMLLPPTTPLHQPGQPQPKFGVTAAVQSTHAVAPVEPCSVPWAQSVHWEEPSGDHVPVPQEGQAPIPSQLE